MYVVGNLQKQVDKIKNQLEQFADSLLVSDETHGGQTSIKVSEEMINELEKMGHHLQKVQDGMDQQLSIHIPKKNNILRDQNGKEQPVSFPSPKKNDTSRDQNVLFSDTNDLRTQIKKNQHTSALNFQKTDSQKDEIKNLMLGTFLFSSLDDEQMDFLVNSAENQTFKKGEFIIREGEVGSDMFIVIKGACECYKSKPNKTHIRYFEQGDVFGELELVRRDTHIAPRLANIQVVSDVCTVWTVHKDVYEEVLLFKGEEEQEQIRESVMQGSFINSLLAEDIPDDWEHLSSQEMSVSRNLI